MFLILIAGPPASGKTTLRSRLVKNGTVISPDSKIGYVKNDPWTPRKARQAWKTSDEDLKEALERNDSVIVFDATFVSPKKRRKYIKMCKEKGGQVGIVYCVASSKTIIERNNNREEFRQVPKNIIYNMVKSFSVPTKEEGFDIVVRYDSEEDKFDGDTDKLLELLEV